jgi:hypothetical protein
MQRGEAEQQRQAEHAEPGGQRQRQGNQQVEHGGDGGDCPPVVTVGDHARDRREHEQGDELRQAQQAQLEGRLGDAHAILAARDVVELIAQDHDHADRAEHGGKARQPEQAKVRNLQRRSRLGHSPRNGRDVQLCQAVTGCGAAGGFPAMPR